jgi:hypothetical protein
MDKKRLLGIIGFIIISLLLGFAIYFVFFKKTPITPTGPQNKSSTGSSSDLPLIGNRQATTETPINTNLPTDTAVKQTTETTLGTANQPQIGGANYDFNKVTTIIDSPVRGVSTAGGTTKLYNSADGKFYKIDANGKLVALDDQVFYNVQNVAWSPKKNESIIEYPDGTNIYYNFDTKKQVTLPKQWQDFSFSPLGDQIAAIIAFSTSFVTDPSHGAIRTTRTSSIERFAT